VAQEHWCSSGFANTDLDLLLGIHKLIVMKKRQAARIPARYARIQPVVRVALTANSQIPVFKGSSALSVQAGRLDTTQVVVPQ
jgi:hypothetical protein